MKIVVAQINVRIGDFSYNTRKIIEAVRWAKTRRADIIAFPNHILSGFPFGELTFYRDFVTYQDDSIQAVASETKGIYAVIGYNVFGKQKVAILSDGRIEHTDIVSINEEELVVVGTTEPQAASNKHRVELQLGASGFHYKKAAERRSLLRKSSAWCTIFVNHTGGQIGDIFDGASLVSWNGGDAFYEMPCFMEAYAVVDTDNLQNIAVHSLCQDHSPVGNEEIVLMHRALVTGIRDFFEKQSLQKAILGLSGGIDSAVAAALATEALGAENIWGILLPSQYSTDHSIKDAKDLAGNLGCKYDIIPIREGYQAVHHMVSPLFRDLPFGLAEENIQARLRAVVLMALSNKFGNILLNTSNKSELAVGYGTLYGDSCGALSVLGDLYKTQVFALAYHINREKKIIPVNTITKPPSAELRPDQKDSDSLPEYELLDAVLYHHIEEGLGIQEITEKGFDAEITTKIVRMVASNEYKRRQTPPVIQISPKAFGHNRHIPFGSLWLR